MHKQLSGIGTEVATSCHCVPSPRGQTVVGKRSRLRESDISPGTCGKSLCGGKAVCIPQACVCSPRGLHVSGLSLVLRGAGAAPVLLSVG